MVSSFAPVKRKDHLRGEVVGLPGFMTLQGKYGAKVVKPNTGERLKIIKAGRQPRSKAGPLGNIQLPPNMQKWILDHLVFFAYLEGMSVERIGNQYALNSKGLESVCVIDGEQTEIYGRDDIYRDLAKITRKWIDLGAPKKNAYLVEAWPLHISKRKPRGGWLVKHHHTQLIFRLKRKHQVSFF